MEAEAVNEAQWMIVGLLVLQAVGIVVRQREHKKRMARMDANIAQLKEIQSLLEGKKEMP